MSGPTDRQQAVVETPPELSSTDRTDQAAPIIGLYMLPEVHGGCRQYCCECLLVVGILLPMLGPVLGLCVFAPYFSLLFEEGSIIQPDTPCYGPTPTTCEGTSTVDYYFWNITNPDEASSLYTRTEETQACQDCRQHVIAMCAVAEGDRGSKAAGDWALQLPGACTHVCTGMHVDQWLPPVPNCTHVLRGQSSDTMQHSPLTMPMSATQATTFRLSCQMTAARHAP